MVRYADAAVLSAGGMLQGSALVTRAATHRTLHKLCLCHVKRTLGMALQQQRIDVLQVASFAGSAQTAACIAFTCQLLASVRVPRRYQR